jgi:hypothetical protein
MTHKYLSQIRTIPSYHGDQSDFAKTLRSVNYTLRSTANLLVKNKKTRIIASVLGVYLILTSGFVVAFVNVDNNQAKAQSPISSPALEIKIQKQNVEADNITVKVEVQNQTNQTITNPVFRLQTSFDNVSWTAFTDGSGINNVSAQDSNFRLTNIGPNQKVSYNAVGKIKNPNANSLAVVAETSYFQNNQLQKLSSPKYLLEVK